MRDGASDEINVEEGSGFRSGEALGGKGFRAVQEVLIGEVKAVIGL